jgi:UDPglucose--hexose-1-phosphate uridylyltransferase
MLREHPVKKTSTRLADGRELLYYDSRDDAVRDAVDRRPLDPVSTTSEVRRDPLLGDPVAIASHRQGRTYHPPADECPLCPSRDGRLSEIPTADYDVAVFENRFPSLAGDRGRCQAVCFTSDHDASFADLTEERAGLVLGHGRTAPPSSPNSPGWSRSSASRTGGPRSG